ncbi:MAG: biotin/lipoyl-binding protein, partial [Actinobacteria bacterium]
MSRRTKIIIGVVALVVIVGAVAYFALGSKGTGPQIDTAVVAKKELAVTVSASGKVEAGVEAEVFAPTQGTLSDVYVTDGETVTAGTKLAQMDTGPMKAQLAQAEAGLAAAKAQYANADAAGGSSADVAAAQAGVTAAKAGVTAAQAGEGAALAAYNAASDAYDAAQAFLPSNSPTLTTLAVAQDQA